VQDFAAGFMQNKAVFFYAKGDFFVENKYLTAWYQKKNLKSKIQNVQKVRR
jgi:hypothetical protein